MQKKVVMANETLPIISETAEVAQFPSQVDEEDGDTSVANDLSASPLWSEGGWSLTWPIWHLLPLHERKQLAHDHGYKTIGEFEEYMSLHQAMDDSETVVASPKPYPNEKIYVAKEEHPEEDQKPVAVEKVEEEEDDDSDSDDDDDFQKQSTATTEGLSHEELLKIAGKILMLHDEILHQVFAWLPVDTYATLALVSPHWKHLTRTEAVYRLLCERLYLNQSKRRQLYVSRFGGSYRTMLEQRPRVRAAGGVYVLKYSQIKKIQRDMWTEVSTM